MTVLTFHPAMAHFATGDWKLEAAAVRIDVDDLGDGLDERFSPWNHDAFQFVRPQEKRQIRRFGPPAFELGTRTRLRKRHNEQGMVILAMREVDLDVFFLKIDAV